MSCIPQTLLSRLKHFSNLRQRTLCQALWLTLSLSLVGCAPNDQPAGAMEAVALEGQTMGTYYRITAYCTAQADLPVLPAGVEATLQQLNQTLSNYAEDSELSVFNRSAIGAWVSVSQPLMDVLVSAASVYQLSDRAFDITVAPLVRLWGFGPQSNQQLPPDRERLSAAQQMVGADSLELQPQQRLARKLKPLELDLSALAKGYGVDVLSQWLESHHCPNHLVDIGGEVRARGAKLAANGTPRPWRVGIEIPQANQRGGVARALPLTDLAVATSGDYRNYIDLSSLRWSHTIDPRTGQPVEHGLASVTVIHPQAMLADAWATAFTVLGKEQSLALANRLQLPVLLIEHKLPAAPDAFAQPPLGTQSFEERFTVSYNELMGTVLAGSAKH